MQRDGEDCQACASTAFYIHPSVRSHGCCMTTLRVPQPQTISSSDLKASVSSGLADGRGVASGVAAWYAPYRWSGA